MNDELPVYIPVRRQYFGGVRRQAGRGFFSSIGNILSKLLPFAKQYILPSIGSAAQNIISDISTGDRPLKRSLKKHSISALKGMAKSYLDQKGSGRKRKRRSKISAAVPPKCTRRVIERKKNTKKIQKKTRRQHKRTRKTTWTPLWTGVHRAGK